ncbi:unnamed protein product [Chrysodeixis includens]|uniref:Serine protease K12H4.7 n=1 Tax=Chrysodeixis includens TaxID=689277 RepID=A0A9P0C0Q4_CHRIL|nr:unnamed protein product [Chrysodeixis includens]
MRYLGLWLGWLLLLLAVPCRARRMREPPPPTAVSRVTPVEHWLRVKLNQFMASDTRTFPMRFYYNDEFAGENIVIDIGGEWEITSGWTLGGLPYDIAKQLRAGLFYTEHRFYGKTRPFNNTEVSSLQYLSVHQALADLAQFIHYIKSDAFERGQFKSGKVVVVGCSYAGSMAAWMRQTYPHLVDVAYADSGPVLAQVAYPEFTTVIIRAIRESGGEECLSRIAMGMKQVKDLLANKTGIAQLSQIFNICTSYETFTDREVTDFLMILTSPLIDIGLVSTYLKLACAVLTNGTAPHPVQRLADLLFALNEMPCMDLNYTNILGWFRNTSYDSDASEDRVWIYQTCTEFGWYQTYTSEHEPYFPSIPQHLDYYLQHCRELFFKDFNEERVRQGVKRTNMMFGGLTHRPDHLISVAGTHDPWSVLAPNASHGHTKSPVYVIPRATHCQALRDSRRDDSQELRNARKAVLDFMYENVYGMTPLSGATHTEATPVLLGLAAAVQFLH